MLRGTFGKGRLSAIMPESSHSQMVAIPLVSLPERTCESGLTTTENPIKTTTLAPERTRITIPLPATTLRLWTSPLPTMVLYGLTTLDLLPPSVQIHSGSYRQWLICFTRGYKNSSSPQEWSPLHDQVLLSILKTASQLVSLGLRFTTTSLAPLPLGLHEPHRDPHHLSREKKTASTTTLLTPPTHGLEDQ